MPAFASGSGRLETAAPSHLARYLAAAYALLIAYGSLHPLIGWRDTGAAPLGFLSAGWPRYYTALDLVANLLVYAPLGFLLVPALHPRVRLGAAAVIAAACALGLSFAMETLQTFLPNRVPSNVDLACNGLGAAVGALLGIRWGHELIDGGRLHAFRAALAFEGKAADFGLVLLGLWLLTQLNPQVILFGTGDLRALLGLEFQPYSAQAFRAIEAGVAGANALAVGLIATSLLRKGRSWLAGALLGAGLCIKALASALMLVKAGEFAYWITPGNMSGLALGALALLVAMRLPALAQQVLAALALLFATALVNLAPENPYFAAASALWQQGHFLNINGLTRLVSSLWPFAALAYLMLPRGRQSTGETK